MERHTFVVRVHPGEGPTTVENVATQERVPVGGLAELGPRIKCWLDEAVRAPRPADAALEGEDGR